MIELSHADTASRFEESGVEFVVERTGPLWFCHSGFKTPRQAATMCGFAREDGWGSLTRAGCARKVARAIRRELKRDADLTAVQA